MKYIKKVFALALAFAMVLAMSATVFAADGDGHTISVKDTDTHEYKVFQVLTGTLAEEGSKQLGNPAWGADATADAKATDVNDFIASLEGKSDQDIAQLVAEKVDTTKAGQGTVKKGSPVTGLATGYYVLVDVTELKEHDGKIDTKALNVVRVVNDVNGIDIKWGTTEDKKEITGDTLGDATAEDPRTPDAPSTDNVSIGDTVNFKITATIPANADLYNYFYFVINDTLDTGLTLDPDSIKVYKESVAEGNLLKAGTDKDYQVKTGDAASPKSFQVGLNDAKSLAGKDIIVTYSAVLNENATIGEVPNKNTSTVTYSNDPNHDYNGNDNKPGFPDQTDLTATGETPASTTETYTTGIEIQKVDQDGNVLTGAEFTITGDSTEIVLVSSEAFTADDEGEYYKLNNGTYTKEAPVTEDYMKEAEAGATKGYVEDAAYTGDDKVVVGGKTYRPVTADDTDKTVYVLVKANADQYDSTTQKYKKTVTYTQKDTTGDNKVDAKAEVGADGVVRFVGLGAGDYTIKETKTPSGYNTLPDMSFNITFTASPAEGKDHWTTTTQDATYNKTAGVFEITIENQQGSELPETGGIGTVIFYVLGSALIIGCGIVLVSRRRLQNNK